MSHVLFILVCVFWGTSFILMRESLAVTTPLGIAMGRSVAGAVAMGLLWLALRKAWPLRWRDAGAILFVTVCGYAIPFVLQVVVIEAVQGAAGHGSSFTGMMVSLVPLLTILASIPLLGVLPTRRQLLGVLGGLAAMTVLFADEFAQGVTLHTLTLAIITPVLYAITNTYVKRRFNDVPATVLVVAALGLCGLMLLGPALWQQRGFDYPASPWRGTASLLVLGVICTGIATFLFYRIVQREGPLFAGMVTYIIPTVAMLWGWIGGEQVTATQVAALAVVFLMVGLTQWGATPRQATVEIEPP